MPDLDKVVQMSRLDVYKRQVVGKVYDGGLEARKAHVERTAVDLRARQLVDAALALVGELVHRRAAGVGLSLIHI